VARWDDLGASARADEELSVGSELHAVVISVGDDGVAVDGHGGQINEGEQSAGLGRVVSPVQGCAGTPSTYGGVPARYMVEPFTTAVLPAHCEFGAGEQTAT